MDPIEIINTIHGPFAVDTTEDAKMAALLKSGKYHQEETLELLGAFITKESVVVDGGAHIGTLAVPLATLAARVIAYEPNPKSFSLLERNASLNNLTIDARNAGLGHEHTQGQVVPVREGNAGAYTLAVGDGGITICALDDEIETVDVIKLDVEGMEHSVLRGADRLLRTSRPVVLFEVNLSQLRAHHTSPRNLERLFAQYGYRLYLPLQHRGVLSLGCVQSISLVTFLIMPGAFVLHRPSSTFDIVALPAGYVPPLPQLSAAQTIGKLVRMNLADKVRRLRKHI